MPDPSKWAALHAACFTTPRPWSAAEIAGLLSSPHVFALGDSRGFLLGRAVAGESELLTLAVDPGQRRQGLGLHLVSAFLEQSKARGADSAFLEVSAANLSAIALYHRAGFAQTGQRRGYYAAPDGARIDALILARPV
jgi:ribosomal-protein-alanine N-acetyltransferase